VERLIRAESAPAAAVASPVRSRLLDALLAVWVLLVFGLYTWRFATDWLAANLTRVAGLF